jgi:hypothetical protein
MKTQLNIYNLLKKEAAVFGRRPLLGYNAYKNMMFHVFYNNKHIHCLFTFVHELSDLRCIFLTFGFVFVARISMTESTCMGPWAKKGPYGPYCHSAWKGPFGSFWADYEANFGPVWAHSGPSLGP